VVNQGGEFRNPQLQALMEGHELIECINMKDSNGFARTWSEGLANSESVYHILMADNVEIDPQIITNLAAFISYLPIELLIGAQVLGRGGMMVPSSDESESMHEIASGLPISSGELKFFTFSTSENRMPGGNNELSLFAVPKKYLKLASDIEVMSGREGYDEFVLQLQEIGVAAVILPGFAVSSYAGSDRVS
jgi:hypothetical protein